MSKIVKFTEITDRAYNVTIRDRKVTIHKDSYLDKSGLCWVVSLDENGAIIGYVPRQKDDKNNAELIDSIEMLVDAYDIGYRYATATIRKGIRDLLGLEN